MTDDGRNPDREPWQYARQRHGTPYKPKPPFCYKCNEATIVPITHVSRD